MAHLWGIDLGGTKIESVILDEDSLEAVDRRRIPTEAEQGYAHILERIEQVVKGAEQKTGLHRPPKIGLGTPGVSDPRTGLMRNANTVCLTGQPLVADAAKTLQTDVVAANDANCFALAEAKMGAAKDAKIVFGVILGTGVGGGIVLNGEVWDGLNGIAGEWGHNVLDPNGDICYCGKNGCVETVLSGPAIARHFAASTGRSLPLPDIARLAANGDDQCAAALQEVCVWFGKAMSVVVNILDPDAIVLGGGVSHLDALYTLGAGELSKASFHDRPHISVRRAKLGDSAGVIGAALLTK